MSTENGKPGGRGAPERRGAEEETALSERIRQHLKTLGIVDLNDEQITEHLSWASKQRPSYSRLLERILCDAASRKRQRRIEERIKQSGLTVRKTLENFEWVFQPGLDQAAIEEIAGLGFVQRREDLIMTGKTGTGKSHILQAVTLRACMAAQYRVRYARCADLIDYLYAALADGTYQRRLRQLSQVDLLVIDDVGLGQVKKRDDEPTAAHVLFNLLDLRHQRASTALSSNIKLSAWGKYLGDATLAGAILDRLAMNGIRIDIDGPSYRQYLAQKRAAAPQKT